MNAIRSIAVPPLRDAWRGSAPLTALAGTMVVLLAVCVVGLVADDRTVLGQPTWLKPAKFALSFVVYGLTLAWLLGRLRRGWRAARAAAAVIAVVSALEIGIIALQAARGRPSHFNSATPLDEWLWRSMGGLIMVLWAGTLLITVLLWRDRGFGDRALLWSARLGLVILLLGLLEGFLMVVPTAAQQALDERGADTLLGAHAVGVPDGGPGLPLTGWSTTGGDLRIGHFTGMHGLQATLLFAMLAGWLVGDAARRLRLVFVFAGTYTGLVALVTWQALRGQPLLRPDAVTLSALAVLVAGAAAAVVLVWRRVPALTPSLG
ncbi:hypothetical protein [Dactylosporangium sp. CA-139066]|uniref:hypothetical protein n=1 Tax=Dactylosporangium sp. CA-139066 TaxID=3239930 RepID=UPI003D93606E